MSIVNLLFGFNGRIGRLQYWSASLAVGVIAMLILFVIFGSSLTVLEGLDLENPADQKVVMAALGSAFIVAIPVFIVMIWTNMALSVKRLHDRDRTGWWMLAYMLVAAIPFINILAMIWYFIELGCLAGTSGANRFDTELPSGTFGASGETGSSWADNITFDERPQQAAGYEPQAARKTQTSAPAQEASVGFGRRGLQTQ